jgi:hypothetical protein
MSDWKTQGVEQNMNRGWANDHPELPARIVVLEQVYGSEFVLVLFEYDAQEGDPAEAEAGFDNLWEWVDQYAPEGWTANWEREGGASVMGNEGQSRLAYLYIREDVA